MNYYDYHTIHNWQTDICNRLDLKKQVSKATPCPKSHPIPSTSLIHALSRPFFFSSSVLSILSWALQLHFSNHCSFPLSLFSIFLSLKKKRIIMALFPASPPACLDDEGNKIKSLRWNYGRGKGANNIHSSRIKTRYLNEWNPSIASIDSWSWGNEMWQIRGH